MDHFLNHTKIELAHKISDQNNNNDWILLIQILIDTKDE